MRVICKNPLDQPYSFAHSSGVKVQIVNGRVFDVDELGVNDKEFWDAVGDDVHPIGEIENATQAPGQKRATKRSVA